jgi:hypothetical protein
MRSSRLARVSIVGAVALALLVPTTALAAPTGQGAANRAPVAIDQSLPVAQNIPAPFVVNAADPDGDALTFTVSTPAHGTLSGVAPNLVYTPTSDYSGPDVFVIRTSDGVNPSVASTVYVSVYVPPNAPPVAHAQSVTTRAGRPLSIATTAVDPNGDPLVFSLLTWSYCHCSAQHGTVTGSAGRWLYTPKAGYTGSDYFEFRVTDSAGAASVARVDITVHSGHRPPRGGHH